MSTPVNATSTNAISAADLANMDIETALMAVQSQRANLLEEQLKGQMGAVQQRNSSIENLNNLLAAVRNQRPPGKTTDTADTGNATFQIPTKDFIPAQQAYVDDLRSQRDGLQAQVDAGGVAAAAAQIALDAVNVNLVPAEARLARITAPDAAATETVALTTALNVYGFKSGNLTQDEYGILAQNITSRIDGLNSTQQLDMLRLQSLTNKRNEAFDIMTNFIKKMQDGRSSIIGNMR
jgi:hypothetical protein